MARRILFNEYEAALLLDAYLRMKKGIQTRAEAVKACSEDLRRMAVNSGYQIDDIYRNTNGISLQMASMESAFQGELVVMPASKLFLEIVSLYREDRLRYEEILKEAKAMADIKEDHESLFRTWLSKKVSASQLSELYIALHEIEHQTAKSKIIRKSIYENFSLSLVKKIRANIEQSRIFKFTHKQQIGTIRSALGYLMQYAAEQEKSSAEKTIKVFDTTSITKPEIVSDDFKKHMVADQTDATEKALKKKRMDFNSLDAISFTKPYELIYFGDTYFVSSWKDAYVKACTCLFEDYPADFEKFKSECLSGHGKIWIVNADNVYRLAVAKEISKDFFVETNRSASDLMKNLKWIISQCRVDYENVSIMFAEKNEDDSREATSKDVSRKYKRDDKESFYSWMKTDQKMADGTCRSYVSAVRGAEKFAAAHGLVHTRLFSVDVTCAKATADELFGNSEFLDINERQHNRFRAAINKLLEFIGAETPEKVVVSSEGNFNNGQSIASTEANIDIVTVLKQHYEYGFKHDSIRELMRFRQFADAMGIELPEDDEELKAAIMSSGTVINGKIYCKNDDMPQELQHIVDDVFSSGTCVIYYECLFENKHEWMESHVITSPDMLKEYLQKNIAGCSFSKKFMVKGSRRSEKEAVTDELKRIWGVRPKESVYTLHDRLPYVPLENIWRVISGNDFFVLVNDGEYLLIDRFRITEEEEEDILDFVDRTCEENGFASISAVPLGSIEEENYELTQSSIYNAIYKKVLLGKYNLNGKILTKEKTELDAVIVLKQYIKEKDECTFDEVADKTMQLTGGINRQYAFQALYDDMVRVDRNRFVANRFVNFSIDEIDTVLDGFITDNFRAIQDVTTFAMFPLCGQNWNHYLLESFCYKYSRKFSLHVIHFNDKNAGIIARKDFNKKYDEMLAIALARTNVDLSPEAIGQYLFDAGYMAKSKYVKLNEIAQRASELRKER